MVDIDFTIGLLGPTLSRLNDIMTLFRLNGSYIILLKIQRRHLAGQSVTQNTI